ncbi:hypothetical protein K1T71_000019 [Dendrolimus kikuchii]|uniref:Uncharacterized protein n=1 Tax=Dendrolimus kikuchii TaxID=765133 RepID=A0ACC1DI82_9NEOP|nr:hypothetical protein K1T71_000019 [Dendrolimus kikuchii]
MQRNNTRRGRRAGPAHTRPRPTSGRRLARRINNETPPKTTAVPPRRAPPPGPPLAPLWPPDQFASRRTAETPETSLALTVDSLVTERTSDPSLLII